MLARIRKARKWMQLEQTVCGLVSGAAVILKGKFHLGLVVS